MTKFLAIDQGTTSTKAIVFDESLSSLKRYSEKIDTMFPKSGWVEQKPQNILQTVKSAINKTISDDVVGLGITNQRETVVIWDRASGNPIYNAIVWQDRRTASRCKELKNLGYEQIVKDKTGLLLDPYFSATKIEWILDNVSNARSDALNGNLAFGTIESCGVLEQ
jgi:glycerol kinase